MKTTRKKRGEGAVCPSQPFRDDMLAALRREDFAAFHAIRLVFADWLADRNDPEEEWARLPWTPIPEESKPKQYQAFSLFPAPELAEANLSYTKVAANAEPVLCFPARSLSVRSPSWSEIGAWALDWYKTDTWRCIDGDFRTKSGTGDFMTIIAKLTATATTTE